MTDVTFWSLSVLYQSLGLAPPEHRFRSSNKNAEAKFRQVRRMMVLGYLGERICHDAPGIKGLDILEASA